MAKELSPDEKSKFTNGAILVAVLLGSWLYFQAKGTDKPNKPPSGVPEVAIAAPKVLLNGDQEAAKEALSIFKRACPAWFSAGRTDVASISVNVAELAPSDFKAKKLGWTRSADIGLELRGGALGVHYWLGAGDEPGIFGGKEGGGPCGITEMHAGISRNFRSLPDAEILR